MGSLDHCAPEEESVRASRTCLAGPDTALDRSALIGARTTLQHSDGKNASLGRYSWTHWSTRLSLPGCHIDDVSRPILILSKLARRLETGKETQSSIIRSKPPVSVGAMTMAEHIGLLSGENKGPLARSFTEASRGLRAMARMFSKTPLHDQSLKEFGPSRSPVEILISLASWMDDVATRLASSPTSRESNTHIQLPSPQEHSIHSSEAKFNLSFHRTVARLISQLGSLSRPPITTTITTFTINSSKTPSSSLASLFLSPLPTPTLQHLHNFTTLHLLTAALLNHLRRIFLPHLFQTLHPIEDLRLALSNPDVFVHDMLGPRRWSWWWFAGGGCWVSKYAWNMLLLLLFDTGPVGELVWAFGAVEDGVARGMDLAGWVVAAWRLGVVGGEMGWVALGRAVEGRGMRLALVGWRLAWFVVDGVWPVVSGSLRGAARGQPGMLVAVAGLVGGVVVVLKYRNTFFIALEVGHFFVFLGFMLAGLAVLGSKALCDFLGLDKSTRLARARGCREGGFFSHEARVRMKALTRHFGGKMVDKSFKEKDC